jgi:hypothetical protein
VPLLWGRARSSGEGGVGGSDRGAHLDNIGRGNSPTTSLGSDGLMLEPDMAVDAHLGGKRAYGISLGRTEIWAKAVIQLEARSAWQGAPCRSRLNSPHFISRPFPRTGGDVRQPARPPSAGR